MTVSTSPRTHIDQSDLYTHLSPPDLLDVPRHAFFTVTVHRRRLVRGARWTDVRLKDRPTVSE